jgi:hypothetical protein
MLNGRGSSAQRRENAGVVAVAKCNFQSVGRPHSPYDFPYTRLFDWIEFLMARHCLKPRLHDSSE